MTINPMSPGGRSSMNSTAGSSLPLRSDPNLTPGQVHEAIVELRHHRPPAGTVPKQIKSVRWSAGPRPLQCMNCRRDSAPRFRAAFGDHRL